MRIGWLADRPSGYTGGAELSSDALVAAAPDWAEVVYCPSQRRPPMSIEAWVLQNSAFYDKRWLEVLSGKPVIKQVRDYWQYGDPVMRRWLLDNAAVLIFSSQPHLDNFQFQIGSPVEFAPPPVDLARFREAGREVKGRWGNVWLGRLFEGKGIGRALDWAVRHDEPLDFYGPGPLTATVLEPGRYLGVADYENVPALLARYEWFVYLPEIVEPFGRAVIEAWYAGCKMDIDEERVGACWWTKQEPQALENAAGLFWQIVEEYL